MCDIKRVIPIVDTDRRRVEKEESGRGGKERGKGRGIPRKLNVIYVRID